VTLGLGEADFVAVADGDTELDDDAEADADGDPDSERETDGEAESVAAGIAGSEGDPVALGDADDRGSEVDTVGDGETEAVGSLDALLSAACVCVCVASGLENAEGSAATAVATGSAEAELATNGIPRAMTRTLIDPATTETIRFLFDDCMASPKQTSEGGLTIDSP
jgi:hypothetical protein